MLFTDYIKKNQFNNFLAKLYGKKVNNSGGVKKKMTFWWWGLKVAAFMVSKKKKKKGISLCLNNSIVIIPVG